MPSRSETAYYTTTFTAELLEKLQPVASALDDSVPIADLKDPAGKEGLSQWEEAMRNLRRIQKTQVKGALGFLTRNNPQADLGYLRGTPVETLADLRIGMKENPARLGADRAQALKDIVTPKMPKAA